MQAWISVSPDPIKEEFQRLCSRIGSLSAGLRGMRRSGGIESGRINAPKVVLQEKAKKNIIGKLPKQTIKRCAFKRGKEEK